MLTLAQNPPIVPNGIRSLAELDGPWWVAHTKSRCEKTFAWEIGARGIGYFLPMTRRISFAGGRRRIGMMPLFPSYVFFCGDESARYHALATNRLCQAIAVTEQKSLIEELTQIERVIQCGTALELYPVPAVGTRCVVRAGPFEGLEGVVIERAKLSRLILKVSVLGQGAVLEIDAELLESLDVEQSTPRAPQPRPHSTARRLAQVGARPAMKHRREHTANV
jgi:hypothetical protein